MEGTLTLSGGYCERGIEDEALGSVDDTLYDEPEEYHHRVIAGTNYHTGNRGLHHRHCGKWYTPFISGQAAPPLSNQDSERDQELSV